MCSTSPGSCSVWSIPHRTISASHGYFSWLTWPLLGPVWTLMWCSQYTCCCPSYALYVPWFSFDEQEGMYFYLTTIQSTWVLQGETLQDPFHRSLASMVQWYDVLQVEVKEHIKNAIQSYHDHVCALRTRGSLITRSPCELPCQSPECPLHLSCGSALFSGKCASILVQYCPACFGGTQSGRLLAEGSDIHIAMDGNFHHWYWWSAEDCPLFYDLVYFLPKREVCYDQYFFFNGLSTFSRVHLILSQGTLSFIYFLMRSLSPLCYHSLLLISVLCMAMPSSLLFHSNASRITHVYASILCTAYLISAPIAQGLGLALCIQYQ